MKDDALVGEQHVYTSTRGGFTTTHRPTSLTSSDVRTLEAGSMYALPGLFAGQKNLVAPVKYNFYPLNDKVVIGRAIYLGLDFTGRSGNYIYHNLLFARSDVTACCEEPVSLIKAAESQSLFMNSPPEPGTELGAIALQAPDVQSQMPYSNDDELVQALVSVLFAMNANVPPILLIGDGAAVLSFMQWLYSLLPYGMRWNVSFDSYSYGSMIRDRRVVALPSQHEYQLTLPPCSLSLVLEDGDWQWRKQISPSPIVSQIAKLERTDRRQREVLISLIDLIENGVWSKIPEAFAEAREETAAVFFEQYQLRILEHITATANLELLDAVRELLQLEDVGRFARNRGLIGAIATLGSFRLQRLLAEWLARIKPPSDYLDIVLSSKRFLEYYFQAVERIRAPVVARAYYLYSLLPSKYDSSVEGVLLSKIFGSQDREPQVEVKSTLVKVLGDLPIDCDDVMPLRMYLRYELGNKALFTDLAERYPRFLVANPRIAYRGLLTLVTGADRSGLSRSLAHLLPQLASKSWSSTELADLLADIVVDETIKERHRRIYAEEFLKFAPNSYKLRAARGRCRDLIARGSGLRKFFG